MLIARPLADKNRVSATCQSSDAIGDLVYVTAGLTAESYAVSKADVSQTNKMPVLACIIAKLTTTTCVIQLSGEVRGIYNSLVPGRVYFVGSNARPTLSPPAPSLGGRAYVQVAGVAIDASVLRLEPIKQMIVRTG